MLTALNIALVLLLIMAFYQDRKYRSIHVLIFCGISLVSCLNFLMADMVLRIIVMNVLFTILVMSGLILYLSVKEKRPVNIFKAHFGLGDLVFLVAVSPLFASQNYIIFFITGIVFSVCTHVLMSQIKRSGETIPLAGYLSLYLICLKSIDWAIVRDLFYAPII